MSLPVVVALLALVALGIVALMRARNLYAVMIVLAVYSVLLAVSFAVLGAVDVSFTEAVVGSSISTILVMLLLRRVDVRALHAPSAARRVAAGTAAAAVFAVLAWAALALPRFGDPASPASTHVSPHYSANSLAEMATPNVVTAVLADYRGFDTLIETAVVLAAALGCLLVMGARARESGVDDRHPAKPPLDNLILRNLLGPLIAAMQLFLLYVVVHGHYGPGGAFQGGTLLACSIILPLLASVQGRWFLTVGPRGAVTMAAVGVLLFTSVGLLSLVRGAEFLDYAALPVPGPVPARRALGSLFIEVGVLLAVGGALVSIYYSLTGSSRLVKAPEAPGKEAA